MPKNNTIKAIIFDWGRTLFDSDKKAEYPEAAEILNYLKRGGIDSL